MTSYMYNPSKKVTEILSKFLEFDPEQLQLGVWSGDLMLTNVNLKGDALYSKINRMKKSPSGRDPLKLKLVEGTIEQFRIQIPWKRLVWGQGDVIIDIKGVNAVVGFESQEETEARQAADGLLDKSKTDMEVDNDQPYQCSKAFRDAKQKVLAKAEGRLMEGQILAGWLAQVIKNELNLDQDEGLMADEKIAKGFEKWMKKASSNFVWRFLSGLQLNIEGFKLVVVQDNIEVGVIMPNTKIHSGNKGASGAAMNSKNNVDVAGGDEAADNKSMNGGAGVTEPPNFEDAEVGNTIDKTIEAAGVSVFVRRQPILHVDDGPQHPQSSMALLPDDYILRPIDFSFSLNFFYPNQDQQQKRKNQTGAAVGSPDNTSVGDGSVTSSKRRRGKRDKHPKQGTSMDGTAETDVGSSFAPDQRLLVQRQRSGWTQDSDEGMATAAESSMSRGPPLTRRLTQKGVKRDPVASINRSQFHRRTQSGFRSAPLVRPDDLGSVYASVMAESAQLTPKFALSMNCGEIKLLCSSQHLNTMNNFFACGARMRNGRPSCTIAEVLTKGDKTTNKRSTFATAISGTGSADDNHLPLARRGTNDSFAANRLRSDFPGRRMSLGIRNELAVKARSRRSRVIRSWWHYAYGVVAYEIQKRKRRRDNFREKYVSFDWDRQKQKRKEYVNLYLALDLDVGQHVDCDASVKTPEVEELLRIEDELPIEQILLYRSIGRALLNYGMDVMPTSLAVLYKDYKSELVIEQRRASIISSEGNAGMAISRRLSMHDYRQQMLPDEDEEENLLSMIGKRCDNGRKCRSYLSLENVQLFDDPSTLMKKPTASYDEKEKTKRNTRETSVGHGTDSGAPDDLQDSKVSFAYDYSENMEADEPKEAPKSVSRRRAADTSDGKTVRTFKTTKMAETIVENMTIADSKAAGGAKVSFSLFFKSVELMLVADERNAPSMARPTSTSKISSVGSSESSDDVSELSFLSEEDFFREQESAPAATVEEEANENPMLSSTDFLLFGLPKNMLLHVILSPLRCSLLGRSGGSKNINFTVGSITASGGGNENLIAIGSRASPTPVPVVSLSKSETGSSHDRNYRFHSAAATGPKEAVKFSVVMQEGQNVLQADVSKVRICLDVPLLLKLLEFPSTSGEGNPKRTLPISHREEARLFILRENPPSKLTEINSSVRIHGVDISVPAEALGSTVDNEDSSESSESGNFGRSESNAPSAQFSAKIIELYSGSAVNDLCNTETAVGQVGSLAMLDVAELVSSRGTLSSHHCVMAVSGVNCALNTETDAFAFSRAPSLLAEPIDLEILLTTNGSTLLDEDSPRQEIVVEVSPVHVLLSETRLMFCSRVMQPWKARRQSKPEEDQDVSMPPRLEALSRLIMRCLDVSIRGVRLSLLSDEQKYPLTPGQKEIIMEECIGDFLSVVSCFDLSFPNEDTLSSAMQVCIDRLGGLGLLEDDAWDCANAALMSFLEDDAHREDKESSKVSEKDDTAPQERKAEMDKDSPSAIDRAIRNAVTKSLVEFPPPDDEMDPERQPSNNLLVIDLPGGANVSTIQLFYDFHLSASLPSLIVSNTAGVRLLRIVSVEPNNYEATGDPEDYDLEPSQPGLVFSRFLLDADYAFGKGGLPLSVLGSDEGAAEDASVRIREKQDDVQIGELEYLFSHKTYVDMMQTISKLKSCLDLSEAEPDSAQREQKQEALAAVKSSFFVKGEIASVLLASDELVPFSRLRFESLYLKQDGKPIDPNEAYVPLLRLVSRTFTLLNLGEEGQFYPDAVSILYSEDMTFFPFQLDFTKNSPPWQLGSKMNLVLRGFRVFLVRQFINELLQYLLNERHGIGKLKHAAKIAAEEAERSGLASKNTTPPLAYKIHVLDSSLILPRSSKSHDMAAIEVAKGLIFNSRHHNSFSMPTETSPFQSERPQDASEPADENLFTRMNFQLHEMRIFSSLGEDKSYHNHKDSPIFRYFYDVDGRAEDNGWVYNKQPDLSDVPPEELEPTFRALSNRRWKEITTGLFSLDIFVDYAPNLRVLISEPIDPENFIIAPRLDVRLSQFCLLVSIWYANMQELPVMFPYSTLQFMGGRDLRYGTVPAEYGTDEYMAVWDDWSCVKTEICILLRNLSMRCTFDPTGYFEAEPEIKPFFDDPDDPLNASCVQIYFTDVVVHTYSDLRGMMRVACSAAGFDLIDERRSKHCQRTFAVSKKASGPDGENKFTTWGDLNWGLESDVRDIDKTLPQPFQLSCFMTKDWALINLGLESANGILSELSPIWFFLGFFVGYWQDPAYGNPGYIGQDKARDVKNVLGASRKVDLKDPEGMNIDFRLWLSKPHLCIPCDLVDPRAPSLRIESETGLWYRFRSIKEYKMQEVVSTGLDLLFANEFLSPRQTFDSRDRMVRHLVEGLSFGLRLDGNNECNHADYALQIPFNMTTSADCSIRSHELNVMPMILDAPTICSPVETPTRFLGPHVCEITVIVEVLPLTSSVMVNFFKGPVDENIQANNDVEEEPGTFSFSGNIGDLRLFAVDPVLGVQLPVAVISISSVVLTASQLSNGTTSNAEVSRGESVPEDLQVTVDCHLWGDYFKLGVTRSWEPLLEPYKCTLLYEKSKYRGQGMSLNADCPLHLNVSGALLLIVDEVVDSFSRLAKDVFGQDTEQELERAIPKSSLMRDRLTVGDKVRLRGDQYLPVIHDIPKPLLGDRVAFSFCNLTGQKVRIHQQEGFDRLDGRLKPAVVTYLDHDESTSLSFDATISVVKNLSVVEVPYPGLPNSQSMRRAKRASKHAVDVQLPGFRWVQGIKVDTFGRKFESLRPRSPNVLGKVSQDWRLDNALQLLVEVGLDNGGRLVTVRSLFEVRNNTTHPLSLLLHPDPQHNPENRTATESNKTEHDGSGVDAVSVVQPGEFYQIPTILLESSLHMGGSHLGSLWVKPNSHDDIAIPSLVPGIGHEGSGETNFDTRFCSKPVQLAKLVDESAVIFEENGDSEIAPEKAKTGIQMACSVKSKAGEQLAPFCYAVEVGRSPIVPEKRNSSLSFPSGSGRFENNPEIHGPVSYTLSVHAPFVITNLLPETGRFELMHAVRRTVLWYGDLKPGQQMPVHSVGLDAPLLLLLNLGFCRTPVGEGALVHHGADLIAGSKENLGLKSLVGKSAGAVGKAVTKSTGAMGKVATKGAGAVGKVVTKGTKQIGKTLTAIADSPDKRALEDPHNLDKQGALLVSEHAPQTQIMSGQSLGFDAGLDSMNSPDGKVHAVESNIYSPNDVAAETAVVDSIGQRLTLSIENIRGGGGQRRIGVYCPFWIVNTTQHSLRYKQESGKSYVCGTVLDSERDGSKPVDGSTRNYVNRHQLARATRMSPEKHLRSHRPMNEGTIFAGTAGALATSPGRCDLSPADLTDLIDKDLSLEKMANLAFMFNFHEDVLSIGNRRLTLQLADATEHVAYYSDWSRGFSLDSVGFSQIVALHCKEGRALELSVVVSVAPGFLSGYTKIVRLVPRYVLVNQLEYPVRLWQDSSVFRTLNEDRTTTGIDELVRGTDLGKWRFATAEDEELSVINQYEALWGRVTLLEESESERILEGTTAHRNASYITTAGPLEFVPFHLPDSRGERQLRIGLGSAWNLTASFASDFPGDHSLRLTRAVDLRFVRHVSTRASSQYKVALPPPRASGGHEWDGELGIWFETDWGGDRRIIVKGMKRGRYCFNETDIHAGDELLRIDNISVSRMSFSETMKLLKQRVTQVAAAAASTGRPSLKDSKMGGSSRWGSLRRRADEPADDASDAPQDRLVLTFRTLEERLRRLRMKAAKNSGMNPTGRGGGPGTGAVDSASQTSHQGDNGKARSLGGLRVEMKPLHHSMFVVIQMQDPENPPFRIENRSLNYTIFYRQRGCEGHSWNHLKPGQSQAYSWEEPMRQKRLAVRASRDGIFLSRPESEAADENSIGSLKSDGATSREVEHRAARSATLRQLLSFHQYVEDEEQGRFGTATTVKLEEIGYRGLLACPSSKEDSDSHKTRLNVEVETDGATRILVVSDQVFRDDEVSVMNRRLETLKRQIREEESRVANLAALRYLLVNSPASIASGRMVEGMAPSNLSLYAKQVEDLEPDERFTAIDELARNITDDFPEDTTIHSRHQVVVEVLEAVGLNPENEIGSCNPYCEVLLKGRSKLRKSFFERRKNRGKTYYQKKSLSPKWTSQIFVFDVPAEAVSVTRGHSIHVRVRNFRYVGTHKLLGQAIVHMHSVRNQEELVGWYPLAGRTGSTELDNPLSHWGRGSIKLRIHWVHSTSALLDYFIMFTEKRLLQLQDRKDGLRDQWRQASDAEKRKKERDVSKSLLTQSVQKVSKEKLSSKRLAQTRDAEGKDGAPKNISMMGIARDRTKLVSSFLNYAKKKRRRRGEDEMDDDDPNFEFGETWVGNSTDLPRIMEYGSSSSSGSSGSDTSLFEETSKGDSSESTDNARGKPGSLPNRRFALERTPSQRNYLNKHPKGKLRIQRPRSKSETRGQPVDRSFARATGKLFANKLLQKLSQRKLTVPEEEKNGNESNDSDSSHGDDRRASTRYSNLDTIKELIEHGFVFHDVGLYFHRIDPYSFHGQTDDGVPLQIPRVKNWSSAQALLNDETLDVKVTGSSYQLVIHESVVAPPLAINSGGSFSKSVARKKLQLPPLAPLSMAQRSLQHVEYLVQSRNQFERASRRTLRSVLNPGGWLTIRPITALNLPDTYTGMHVKLRYGPEVVVSSSVDAKVTPTWTPKDVMNRVNTMPDIYEEDIFPGEEAQSSAIPPALNMDRFEFYENDLLFYVEPQKTSGSIRLSVVGERLNNKTELGVLHIPLGAAIGSCIDCIEDYMDSFADSAPSATPMYVRWFPLMNPKDTDPVEGDMGLSSRPPESEKLGDDMFQQYFAPCIQLALMWWPDDRDTDFEVEEEMSEHQVDGSHSFRPSGPSVLESEKSLTNNYFNADIGRISAALIDSERAKELLSFSALDIDVRYSVTDSKTRMGLVIGWVQLDHQEDKSREPVVLAPKPVEHIQPTCQLLVVKDNLRSKKNIVSYEHIRLTVEEMDLTVEESWLFDLWDFFIGVVRRREVRQKANRGFAADTKGKDLLSTESRFIDIEISDPDAPSLLSLLVGAGGDGSSGKVYVEQLVLGLLKVNLSYVKGKKQSWELTEKGDWVSKTFDPNYQSQNEGEDGDPSEMFTRWSQHTYDEDLWAERQGKRSQNLKGIIGAVLPNVSDAPIRLQGKVLDNVFESPSEILSSISKFYVMETLRQVYKIVGSLDFVGNPTMLFSSFVSGVRDLVVTPSVAFLRSPTNPSLVGTAVAKGTLSLFSHSTSGIFGFIAKTTAAAGQATAMLSFDPEYREWHRERVVTEATNLNREWKKRGVESVSAMMMKPVGDLTLGVAMGVSGLFTAPYKGYRNGGNFGLVQGIAIGGIGLITKPIVGLLDAFAHFTASVHDIAKSVNILERRYQPVLKLRLPYIFALNNVLTPFDSVSARSAYLLKTFPFKSDRHKSHGHRAPEIHIASEVLHMEPGVDTYSIVTTLRVVLIRVRRESAGRLGPTLCWEVGLAKEEKVKSQVSDHGHNGVALTITRRYKPSGGRFRKKSNSSTPASEQSKVDKSMDSDDHFNEDHPGDDEGETDISQVMETENERPTKVRWDVTDKEDAYHSHGATHGDAGETLEWFTVLAEYPNRPQLTRIHNAISCMLGNFDAVTKGQRLSPGLSTEGCTTFGLFEFGDNSSDELQHKNTERYLMAALERLPWMQDSTFEVTRGKIPDEQRAIVKDIREKWVFSRELEASIGIGGPAWLVEARAHAMFVPSESPLPPPPITRSDPVVKQIIYQQEHGNISREQVRKLFECHMEDLQLHLPISPVERNTPESGIWRKRDPEVERDEYEPSFTELARYSEHQAAFSKVKNTVVHPGKDRPNLADFDGHLETFESAFEHFPTTVVRPGSVMSASYDDSEDDNDFESVNSDGLASGQGNLVPKNLEELARGNGNQLQLNFNRPRRPEIQKGGKEKAPGASHLRDGSAAEGRIDRMEGLMEQLIVFNSQLALMKGPSLAGSGGSQFQGAQGDNNNALQEEIVALRDQLERQATKDEATNEVLFGLREELANIRAELAKPDKPESSKKKKKREKKLKQKIKKNERPQEQEVVMPNHVLEHDAGASSKDKKKRRGSMRWFAGRALIRGSSKKNKLVTKGSGVAESSLTSSLPPGLLGSQDGDGAASEEKVDDSNTEENGEADMNTKLGSSVVNFDL